MSKILLNPPVYKQLRKINKVEQKKIVKKLQALSSDPFAGKALQGELKGFYSLRAWPYRIIYENRRDTIIVYSIAHRQWLYRKRG